jgi:hypothetical protein
MKTTIRIKAMILSCTLLFIGAGSVFAQDKTTTVKNMVESQQYVFKAQFASPTSGVSRSLTSDYDLTISKNAVISYLPYFGRAYVAPIDPTHGGIMFTSNKFEYKKENSKKDGWDIMIVPKDASDVQKLYLHISSDGYATLQVTSTNRQPISFNGYIEENKQPKKAF